MPNPVVPEEVSALASQLAKSRPMRRGSVSERYVKCNKAGCACADRTDARHGPYYSVTRVVKGRTKSRWLDAEQGSSLNFPVKSPYGSPRSVKLLIPPTCLAGEARCEAPRLS